MSARRRLAASRARTRTLVREVIAESLEARRVPEPDGAAAPSGATRATRLRFVVETAATVDLDEVRAVAELVFRGERPGILPAIPGLPSTARHVSATRVEIEVRMLFPGRSDERFGLDHFAIVAVGVDPAAVQRRLGRGVGALYDVAHELRDAGGFVRVDPEVPFKRWRTESGPPPSPAPVVVDVGGGLVGGGLVGGGLVGGPVRPSSPGSTSGAAGPIDHAWNLRAVGMPFAFSDGAGVRVGQVDTGTLDHPECAGIYAPVDQHGCTLDGETSPVDPLHSLKPVDNPAHGIATASVLASRGGFTVQPPDADEIGTTPPPGSTDDGEVTGVAPGCTVVPVRAIRSVWLNVSTIDLAQGVWHCLEQDVDVITISVGGLCHLWLERVISYAVFRNVVVVAAGGQMVPFVPAPAVYPDCIAVTATTPLGAVWDLASRGPAIDLAAPGVGVWCADADLDGTFVSIGNGTSFAAPAVAGAAAHWLARHGRADLVARYGGGPRLAEVFRHLARSTAYAPGPWVTSDSGAGVVQISALLDVALPDGADVPARGWDGYAPTSEEEVLRSQLGNPGADGFRGALARWFGTSPDGATDLLATHGTEVMSLLATVPGAFERLADLVAAEVQGAAQAAQDAVEELVDDVRGAAGHVLGTVMGWFD